jgi:hypothetical protein
MGDVVQMVPIVPDLPYPEILDWFRSRTTEELKRMWDFEPYHIHCDEIHRVMNERGHGAYVCV